MPLQLMKLFDGYVKNYHTLKLTVNHGKHSFTMTEIEYFSRLGSMMGYDPFTEDTCNGSYRPMDLTWWDNFEDDQWNDFILHLERENYFNKDVDTLHKLFDERDMLSPQNAIGILKVQTEEKMEELIVKAKQMSKLENALLVFWLNAEVHAVLLNKDREIERKIAYLAEIDGNYYMTYKKETAVPAI